MKVEKGVLVMKNGKAWGITYQDGHSTSYGWVDPVDGKLADPMFCKHPTDVTYTGSPYYDELSTADLVLVERITKVIILEKVEKPIKWIILEDMFEGTVEQFADCFFSNVDEYTIKEFAEEQEVECRIFY